MPELNLYDNIIDPLDYLESYNTFILIQGAIDALLYLAFLATLWKVARVWYSRLESRSITSLDNWRSSLWNTSIPAKEKHTGNSYRVSLSSSTRHHRGFAQSEVSVEREPLCCTT